MKDALGDFDIKCDGKKIENESDCQCPEGFVKIIYTIWINQDPANTGKDPLNDPMRFRGKRLDGFVSDFHFYRQEAGSNQYTSIPQQSDKPTKHDTWTPQQVQKNLTHDGKVNEHTYCCCQCP